MRAPTIVLIIALAAAVGARADAASTALEAVATPALEKELLATMSAVADAVARRDVAALQRLLHDELVYAHSDTRMQSKADLLNEAKEGKGPGNVNILEATVHVYGSTAIIRGRAGTPSRRIQSNNPHATAVFVKGPAGWQLVARTATRAADPAAGRPLVLNLRDARRRAMVPGLVASDFPWSTKAFEALRRAATRERSAAKCPRDHVTHGT